MRLWAVQPGLAMVAKFLFGDNPSMFDQCQAVNEYSVLIGALVSRYLVVVWNGLTVHGRFVTQP